MIVWLAPVAVPLALAAMLAAPGRLRGFVLTAAPFAALPALLLAAVAGPGDRVELDWLLLGGALALDDTGLVFLVLTGALWLAAGLFARAHHRGDPRRVRAFAFLLLAMAGNVLLVLAADLATFYAGFALMTFSAYGLVVHDGTSAARRAGRVYIVLAVLGEGLLLAGFVLAGAAAGGVELAAVPDAVAAGPWTAVTTALLLAGFGVKAGLLGLHVWLPLAHPVAPTPASAVLSGTMIKAGVLGWLRFLPLGTTELRWAAALLVVLGIAGAFGGALAGALQRDAKTNLAYSSVSQIGLMAAVIGVGLAAPEARATVLAAVSLYALHHGLTKGALFMAVGVVEHAAGHARVAVLAVVGVLAAGLAAAPFTAGAVAKQALKDVAALGPLAPDGVVALLTLSGAATTVLMVRLLMLLRGRERHGASASAALWLPWAALAGAAIAGGWLAPELLPLDALDARPSGAWAALWPVLLGLVAAGFGLLAARRRADGMLPSLPAGDVLAPASAAGRVLVGAARPPAAALVRLGAGGGERIRQAAALLERPEALGRLDRSLARWEIAGLTFALLALIIGAALW